MQDLTPQATVHEKPVRIARNRHVNPVNNRQPGPRYERLHRKNAVRQRSGRASERHPPVVNQEVRNREATLRVLKSQRLRRKSVAAKAETDNVKLSRRLPRLHVTLPWSLPRRDRQYSRLRKSREGLQQKEECFAYQESNTGPESKAAKSR